MGMKQLYKYNQTCYSKLEVLGWTELKVQLHNARERWDAGNRSEKVEDGKININLMGWLCLLLIAANAILYITKLLIVLPINISNLLGWNLYIISIQMNSLTPLQPFSFNVLFFATQLESTDSQETIKKSKAIIWWYSVEPSCGWHWQPLVLWMVRRIGLGYRAVLISQEVG